MFEVGARGYVEPRIELHNVELGVIDGLLIVFCGGGSLVEFLIDLCHDEIETSLGLAILGAVEGQFDILDSLFVAFLR